MTPHVFAPPELVFANWRRAESRTAVAYKQR